MSVSSGFVVKEAKHIDLLSDDGLGSNVRPTGRLTVKHAQYRWNWKMTGE
jgi:hypothetical protein